MASDFTYLQSMYLAMYNTNAMTSQQYKDKHPLAITPDMTPEQAAEQLRLLSNSLR